MPAEAATTIDTKPTPPRFWWLKRLGIGFFAFVAAVLILRYAAVRAAQSRLEREVQTLRTRGEPILPEDFAEPPAAQEQNAAADLLAAQELFAIADNRKGLAWDALPRTGNFSTADLQLIDEVLEANREALAAIRRARGKPLANWGLRIRSPVIAVMLRPLNSMRDLTQMLAIKSRRELLAGRDGQAVEDWRDMLVISHAISSQPFVVSQLVANGNSMIASNTISAATLRIGGPGGASEAQVRGLIDELLDDGDRPHSGWRYAFMGERMAQLDLVMWLAGGKDFPSAITQEPGIDRSIGWWLRPLFLADARELLQVSGLDIAAAGAPDSATANAMLTPARRGIAAKHYWDMTLRNPNLSRLMTRRYQTMLARRQAAVMLASRLFLNKYGRNPTSVQEMVPEFLKQAPLDPVAGGGAVVFMPSAPAPTTNPNRY